MKKQIAIAAAFLVLSSASSGCCAFTYGDIYTSGDESYGAMKITHHSMTGAIVDTITVPSAYGRSVRGLAFGPDHRLYAVVESGTGFRVLAFNSDTTIQSVYSGSSSISGGISYGKIAFSTEGDFFVAAANKLVAFAPEAPTGRVIYAHGSIIDVAALPWGNLLVLSEYSLDEITTDGTLIRHVLPSFFLSNAQGVAYDADTDTVLVTMLGYTGFDFQLMRFDSSTGALLNSVYFLYGNDIVMTPDRQLIVGSRSLPPGVFDENLVQIGSFAGNPQLFVAQLLKTPLRPFCPPPPPDQLAEERCF